MIVRRLGIQNTSRLTASNAPPSAQNTVTCQTQYQTSPAPQNELSAQFSAKLTADEATMNTKKKQLTIKGITAALAFAMNMSATP
jgi:hypothetical protein